MNPKQHLRNWLPSHAKIFVVLVITMLVNGCVDKRNNKEIVAGTSLELATERHAKISNVRYDLNLAIPLNKKDSIKGEVNIDFNLKDNVSLLQLDFNASSNLKEVTVNENNVEPHWENEHVVVKSEFLRTGANTVRIKFIAGEAALNRNDDYLYALFVPARASTCFPVFDQPDIKATYKLTLDIPHDWEAMSNGAVAASRTEGDRRHVVFNETKPTSTYQFAFTAGKFKVASDAESGMKMFYRETDSIKVAANVKKIFGLHKQSLAWLKEYTGIDYPYEKFEFALMPAFQFGGMEHPGNIYYREGSLFLEATASVNDELRRAALIAHETAHMWFGNLVTMKWFNDVWLKEVFANFMAGKIVNPGFPQVNHDLRFLMSHYPAAYDVDRTAGSHPVQQELDNLKNAGSVYGAIIYQKAPVIMRNLESLMGEENFQAGLREYLKMYSYGNATWDDLITVMKKHTSQDLEIWNKAWIKSKGMPEMVYSIKNVNQLFITVSNDTLARIWPQSFHYYVGSNDVKARPLISIEKDKPGVVPLPDTANLIVIPNISGIGYGYFKTDRRSSAYMLSQVNTFGDPVDRAVIWMNIWEYLLHGEIAPQAVLSRLIETIPEEKNPLLLEYLTDKAGRIFWQFLLPRQRAEINTRLDKMLFSQIRMEKDVSLKRILFNCYRNVGTTPDAISHLREFWEAENAAGIKLSERDRIQLVMELALRESPGHEDLLKVQLEQTSNPDRAAELRFIMPAVSSSETVRDNFFQSLKDRSNRTHEPWVLEAQRYLNHPLRAESSLKYVQESLELLEEMQQTGDIFFPKGWLDASIGEYQSKEVADVVRAYLKTHPGLRNDLKNKLLQSSDMLFRAESITSEQFSTRR